MTDIDNTLEERGSTYGEFIHNASTSQQLKTALWFRMNSGHYPFDVMEALEMICHKMARIVNGDPNHLDSWVDIAGYATLVAQRIEREAEDQ